MEKIIGKSEIIVHFPIQEVYDYLADFRRHPEWVKNVYKLSPLTPPTAAGYEVGAKFRTFEFTPPTSLRRAVAATLQFMLGLLKGVAPMSICEITALEPTHRIAWVGYLQQGQDQIFNRAEWELVLQAQGNETHITQRFCYLPQTDGARKMLAALGDSAGIAASCDVSLANLQQVLAKKAAQLQVA